MTDTKKFGGLQLDILPLSGLVNLRGGAEILPVITEQLGQKLPVVANTMSFGEHVVYWLSPDEWVILSKTHDAVSLVRKLRDALSGSHASVTDISGGYAILRLSGITALNLLSKGCTLDLCPTNGFVRGSCAQSGLAKTNVILGCIEESTCYEVLVRRSFSDYLTRWFGRVGAEYGIQIIRSG